MARWDRDDDGVFRKRERLRPTWAHGIRERLWALEAWGEVLAAIQANEVVARQTGTLVGSSHRATRLETWHLGLSVLPRPDERDRVSEVFDERYADLESFLMAGDLEQVVVWPVPNLSLPTLPLTLEPDLEVDRLTDTELATALDLDLVKMTFPGETLVPPEFEGNVGLRYHYWQPKVVGATCWNDDDQVRRAWLDTEVTLRSLQACFEEVLALVLDEPKRVAGRFIVAGGRWTPFGRSVAYDHASLSRRGWLQVASLDSAQAAVLRSLWQMLRQLPSKAGAKGLALALRRLSYQAQRERPEDELLDLMIAAEALYLSDLGNEPYRGELRYRLALRAAVHAQRHETPMPKREVFRLMQTAYDARSAIAHGGTPQASRLKLTDNRVSLAEVVAATRAVLRAASRAAVLEAVSGRWPPPWDDLVLA